MQNAILAEGDEVRWFLAGNEIDKSYLKPNENQINDVKTARKWNPDAVITPGNFIPSFIPGLKVGIFHGFNIAKSTRSDARGHFNIRGCFDLYCTQGPATTLRFQELAKQHGHFKVIETGWPALDPLFSGKPDKQSDKPTLLYCSTFTPELCSAPELFDTLLALSQKSDYRWLVQFHPKMPESIVNQYKALQNENLNFVETDNVVPLLQLADVMLCDTSSMIPMFLVQEKPVVTFKNQSRDMTLPIINITDTRDVEPALKQALTYPADLMSSIKAYANQVHPYTDGQSSQRVLSGIKQEIEHSKQGQLRAKPRNVIRNFKERKKLGYWSLF